MGAPYSTSALPGRRSRIARASVPWFARSSWPTTPIPIEIPRAARRPTWRGPGSLGGTCGGNPVVCAAAIKAVDEIEKALPGTRRLEALIRKRLGEMAEREERIGEARGLGAMWALEFVKDRQTKEPDVDLARAVQAAGLRNGLLLLTAGFYNNCIRLLPPINIPLPLMEKALDLLEDSLDMAVAGKGL